ncbi:Transcriptional regulatory protein [Shewanella piezotolerans WP3]|uniref:Transcriptional regulatory protein n=1 Tax=Shewanella piezotolerans (strain WP3 / JCM 13877) TaxID=225849 RepID=B8CQQ2_SHEPW|nr:winged helix-turn-helix domain-containing protein [Shewanella piezotolerans]ACJ30518.1 Transcriptional regulatory protein [Shewanella piezotolerans WP3]
MVKLGIKFELGRCIVDPSDHSLRFLSSLESAEACTTLQPKFIEVLAYLASRFPDVVSREEIIEHIWDGNAYVGSKALTNAIWHLRQQLSPISDEPIIETVRKSGYRLLIEPQYSSADLVDDVDVLQQLQSRAESLTIALKRSWITVAAVSVISLITLAYHLYHDQIKMMEPQVSRLSWGGEAERFPAVSPDGQWLVYGSRNNGQSYSLYLKDLSDFNSSPKRLTSNASREARAVWSSDGTALYFPSTDKRTGDCFIKQFTIATANTVDLSRCNSYMSALDLAPNDTELAYIGFDLDTSTGGLYTVNLQETEAPPRRLSCLVDCNYRDRDLAYSTDGKWLAIARRFGNISEDIFIRNRATGEELRLTEGLEDIRGLSWHQDNKRLVFSTETSGVRNGFIIDISTKQSKALNIAGFSYPSFLANSNALVFERHKKEYQIVYLATDAAVASAPFPMLQSGFSFRNPDYSEQTKRIVYVSNLTGANELWTADINGENRRQLTRLNQRVAYPKWSHDGKNIAFLAPDAKGEGNVIHILNLASQSLSILTSPYIDHGRLNWSHDDSAIFTSTDDGLTQFFLSEHQVKVISDVDIRLAQATNDGRLLFTRDDKNGLWEMELDKPDKLTKIISSSVFREKHNWTVVDNGLFFKANGAGFQQINYWNFSEKALKPIIRLPSSSLSSFGSMSYSIAEQQLLMTLSKYSERDVMMLEHKLLR